MDDLSKIAKRIMFAFLRTKNIVQQQYLNYAKKKADCLDSFFKNDILKKKIIHTFVKINPSEVFENAEDKNIEVGIILLYQNELTKKDYIDSLIKSEYNYGMGEALIYNNKPYIVVYGSSVKKFNCCSKKYFK